MNRLGISSGGRCCAHLWLNWSGKRIQVRVPIAFVKCNEQCRERGGEREREGVVESRSIEKV